MGKREDSCPTKKIIIKLKKHFQERINQKTSHAKNVCSSFRSEYKKSHPKSERAKLISIILSLADANNQKIQQNVNVRRIKAFSSDNAFVSIP